MERRKKIGLVVLVLGAGIGLALQFRKVTSEQPAATGPLSPAKSFADSAAATSPAPAMVEKSAADVAGISSTLSSASRHIESVSSAPRRSFSALVEVNPAGQMIDLHAPEETHTIVDGDTLVKLAARYLGSADHWQALFEHNRDVLRSPEELPIGAVLRIPSLVTLPAPPNEAAPPPTPVAPPLVPATPTDPVQLNKLINADAAKAPSQKRSYTVQPGDSLVDLARKFYGDGRRYETLFEANRQVLANPTQLKPGTVLVVP